MEAKSKQEDYQSKFARDMDNFHHGGGNGVNAYGGNNHRNGNFTPKRHNGEEITNVEHCDLTRDRNIEKESIKIKEKERVENKERLVERSLIEHQSEFVTDVVLKCAYHDKEPLHCFSKINGSSKCGMQDGWESIEIILNIICLCNHTYGAYTWNTLVV
ncbi:hypothetical protein M9H77_23320 [Catharanthus roseus]|uniref:Uncharacterized protein n=1 Tax=Catharanthus roseus TaxID=4058 RepID=A0ACC0AU72_CATRO|nr:hypothetical protein M9H77_23320 [Catharanthus roseus]